MNWSLQVVMRLQFRKRSSAELFSRIILPQARELSRKRSVGIILGLIPRLLGRLFLCPWEYIKKDFVCQRNIGVKRSGVVAIFVTGIKPQQIVSLISGSISVRFIRYPICTTSCLALAAGAGNNYIVFAGEITKKRLFSFRQSSFIRARDDIIFYDWLEPAKERRKKIWTKKQLIRKRRSSRLVVSGEWRSISGG
jgi:hypothetical protein